MAGVLDFLDQGIKGRQLVLGQNLVEPVLDHRRFPRAEVNPKTLVDEASQALKLLGLKLQMITSV